MENNEVKPLAGAVSALRMLADGSISVTLVFEPKDRQDVMTMMGTPGAPIACVRLKDGYAAASPTKDKVDERGPLCKEAINLCRNALFQDWALRGYKGDVPRTESAAKAYLQERCGIKSRKELDTNASAAETFRRETSEFLGWARDRRARDWRQKQE